MALELKFKIEENPDAKSFRVTALEEYVGMGASPKLHMYHDDPASIEAAEANDPEPSFAATIDLPAGFGKTIMEAIIKLDDLPFELDRFEDGIYWFELEIDATKTSPLGYGFMAIITQIMRLQNLKLDHRDKTYEEIEESHYRWMIFQCAVWATEVGQTNTFNEHLTYLKDLLPYMEEINQDYDYIW